MRHRITSSVTLFSLLLLLSASSSWASTRSDLEADVIEWAGTGPNTAFVFVDFDLYTTTSAELVFGVRFTSETITGEEAILMVAAETGLDITFTIWPGMGMAMDEMVYVHNGVEYRAGYDFTWTNWWNYWPSGDLGQTWDYSLVGASARILNPGDTDGWIFGNGTSGPNGPRIAPDDPTDAIMITYKNCDPVLDGASLFVMDAKKNASLKIISIKPLNSPVPEKKNTLFIANCEMIQDIVVSGSLSKFFTTVPVKSLGVSGTLKSLTTKESLVEWTFAGQLGKVKMAGPLDSPIANCAIETPGSGKASLSLTGGILSDLNAPDQNFSSILICSKKKSKTEFLQGGIAKGDIVVGGLGKLTGKDAVIRPTTLTAGPGMKFTKLSVALGSVAFFSGLESLAFSGVFNLAAQKVSVSATGGDIGMETLLASGEIRKISARETHMRMGKETFSVGGFIRNDFGNTSAPIALFVSGTSPQAASKDIRSVYASRGLLGHFVAGAASADPVEPMFTGRVRVITTGKTRKGNEPATLSGAAWSSEEVNFKGANHDDFEVYTSQTRVPFSVSDQVKSCAI